MKVLHKLSNGYAIRLLHKDDNIVDMIKEFHSIGPHKEEELTDKHIIETMAGFVDCDIKHRMCVVLLKDNTPVGLLFAIASEGNHLVIKSKIGVELVWWVNPEHRSSGMGLKLLEAFEIWGAEIGCTHLVCSHIHGNDTIAKVYKQNKYKPIEETYIKVLK